jgi:hypothetical protein
MLTQNRMFNSAIYNLYFCSKTAFAQSTDSSLGPANIRWVTKNRVNTQHLCLHFTSTSMALSHFSCNHLEWLEQQDCWINILWWKLNLSPRHQWLSYKARPHLTNHEITISWTTYTFEHSVDWDCLTTYTSHPLSQIFLYLNLKLVSVPQRWANMLTLPFLLCIWCISESPFFDLLTNTHLFNWCIRVSDRPTMLEPVLIPKIFQSIW